MFRPRRRIVPSPARRARTPASSVASAQVLREGAGGLGLGKGALTARPAEDFAKEPGQEMRHRLTASAAPA